MKHVGKLITLSTLAASGAGLAGTAAYGYWATTGQGTGSAQVGTLNAATSVTATAGSNGSVQLSWVAPTAPDGGAPTGYLVERILGGTAVNACGTSPVALLSGSATTCDDTVSVSGTYTYRVTTFFRSWSAQSSSAPVVVSVDTTAPDAPVVNAFGPVTGSNKTAITVGGTAEPYASLTLTFSDGAGHTVTRTTTAVAAGTWGLIGNDLSGLNDGTVTLSVTATDAAANTSAAGTRTATKDTVQPSVSIGVAGGQSNPTNGTTVRFGVTFSEGVTGFDPGDITLSGTAGGTKVVTITPTDSANYIVAVSGITGAGTVTATVNAGAAFDGVSQPSTAAPASSTITVDAAAPTVTSVVRLDANPATSSTVSFLVTFSETVLNVDLADFAPATTGAFGTTAAGISSVTGSGSVYTVIASTGSGVGNATLGLKLAASPTITDAAGNSAAGNGTATGTNDTYTLSAVTVTSGVVRAEGPATSNRTYTFSGQVGGNGGSVKVEIFGNAAGTGTPAEVLTVNPSGTAWSAVSTVTYKAADAKSYKVTYTAANGRTVTNALQTF